MEKKFNYTLPEYGGECYMCGEYTAGSCDWMDCNEFVCKGCQELHEHCSECGRIVDEDAFYCDSCEESFCQECIEKWQDFNGEKCLFCEGSNEEKD